MSCHHPKGPRGFQAYVEWLGAMGRTHLRRRCPRCGRLLLWVPRLRRECAGDYRTRDDQWRILQPWAMDDGLERRWLVMAWSEAHGGWETIDEDFATLGEARAALAEEMG